MNARFLPALPLGALVIGSIGPWATASVGGFTATKNGLDGDGAITLVLALIAGGLLAAHLLGRLGRAAPIAATVVAAIALLTCVVDLIDAAGSKLGVDTAPGWGLWLAALGAAGLLALCVVLLRGGRPALLDA
jgi:peptidoglycan/LPS O-acetylase OafA/YrhL